MSATIIDVGALREAARILECSDSEYYLDPCAVPSLTASTAKRLVNESPAHAYLYHPRLGGNLADVSKEMDRGSLIDSLLLGGKEIVVVSANPDWTKKADQAARKTLREAGVVPCLQREFDAATETVSKIKERLSEFNLALDESQQFAIEWWETASNGNKVLCRGKLDNFSRKARTIWDLKIRDNVKPRKCESHIIDMGYDIQGAAYVSAVEKLFPEIAGRVRFLDLFCEPEAPHCMTPIEFAGSLRELGSSKWQRAIDTWEHCLRTNIWPGYVTEIYRAEAPAWAIAEEQYA